MRQKQGVFSLFLLSPSSRRAWIEIFLKVEKAKENNVALLAEGVDRNARMCNIMAKDEVALLAEGVDRNNVNTSAIIRMTTVALLAEGVDRNYFDEDWYREMPMSPSSRRAWIEI